MLNCGKETDGQSYILKIVFLLNSETSLKCINSKIFLLRRISTTIHLQIINAQSSDAIKQLHYQTVKQCTFHQKMLKRSASTLPCDPSKTIHPNVSMIPLLCYLENLFSNNQQFQSCVEVKLINSVL